MQLPSYLTITPQPLVHPEKPPTSFRQPDGRRPEVTGSSTPASPSFSLSLSHFSLYDFHTLSLQRRNLIVWWLIFSLKNFGGLFGKRATQKWTKKTVGFVFPLPDSKGKKKTVLL